MRTTLTDISKAKDVSEAIAFIEDCADEVCADADGQVGFEDAAWEIAQSQAYQLWAEEKYELAHEILRCYLGIKPMESPTLRSLMPTQPVFATWLAQRGSLSIEMKTGMRHSQGSVLKKVNLQHHKNFRTKKQAWEYLNTKIKAHLGEL